jgi:hypothetical protein
MTQQSKTETECNIDMNTLRDRFWKVIYALIGIMILFVGTAWKINNNKANGIASASIHADERLEKRLDKQEERQLKMSEAQASMAAKLDIHMMNLTETCNRIEAKQARIETRLEAK